MIERVTGDGISETCEMRDIRQGDVFRTVDDSGTGPWLIAAENAAQGPSPRTPGLLIWRVKIYPGPMMMN